MNHTYIHHLLYMAKPEQPSKCNKADNIWSISLAHGSSCFSRRNARQKYNHWNCRMYSSTPVLRNGARLSTVEMRSWHQDTRKFWNDQSCAIQVIQSRKISANGSKNAYEEEKWFMWLARYQLHQPTPIIGSKRRSYLTMFNLFFLSKIWSNKENRVASLVGHDFFMRLYIGRSVKVYRNKNINFFAVKLN